LRVRRTAYLPSKSHERSVSTRRMQDRSRIRRKHRPELSGTGKGVYRAMELSEHAL